MACLDGFMNIAMEQTEEWVNGELKAKYGECFIRGNNGSSFNDNYLNNLFYFLVISSIIKIFLDKFTVLKYSHVHQYSVYGIDL